MKNQSGINKSRLNIRYFYILSFLYLISIVTAGFVIFKPEVQMLVNSEENKLLLLVIIFLLVFIGLFGIYILLRVKNSSVSSINHEIADISNISIMRISYDFRILYISKKWASLFQYESEEVVGKYLEDVFSVDIPKAFPSKHDNSVNLSLDLHTKTGSPIPIQWHCINYFKNNEFVVFCKDMSRINCIENLLRNATQEQNNLFNNSAIGIVIVSQDLKIIRVNLKFMDLVGYSLKEIVGEHIEMLFEKKSDTEKLTESLLEERDFEINLRHKNGIIICTLVTIRKYSTESGGVEFIITMQDISIRKEYETKLEERKQLYQSLFENTGSAVAIFNRDGLLLNVSNRFETLCGLKKEEVEEKMKWTDFVHKDDLLKMKRLNEIRNTNPDAAIKEYSFRFIDTHGVIRKVFCFVDKIPDDIKVVASLVDIDYIKENENNLDNL